MKQQRSQVSLLGLMVILAGCASQTVTPHPSSVVQTRSPSPSINQTDAAISKPFQELLTDTAASPPLLIPDLSPAEFASGRPSVPASGQGSLPLVSFDSSGQPLPIAPNISADTLLPVPVPPAPTVIRTVPIPNPAQPVVTVPARSQPVPVQSPLPARSPSAQPQVAEPQPAAQPQTVGVRPNVPPSPSPSSASVVVTGVVQVGNSLSAIVQVSNESGSRYVREGEYLANGSILVKQIAMPANDEPTVVFVQDGVEIVRTVGSR